MRAFLMLYVRDFESDDNRRRSPYLCGKSRLSEGHSFHCLASACNTWRLTLTGWPQSPTGGWVRHQLTKLIERKFFV